MRGDKKSKKHSLALSKDDFVAPRHRYFALLSICEVRREYARKEREVQFLREYSSRNLTLKNANKYCQNKKKTCISARYSHIMTELVSRVLYAFRRSGHLSSLIIADKFKPCGSATMKRASSPSEKPKIKVLHRIGFTADLCCHRNG